MSFLLVASYFVAPLIVMLANAYSFYEKEQAYKIYYPFQSVKDFFHVLAAATTIERIDADRADPDNIATALLRVFQRRRNFWFPWRRFKNHVFGGNAADKLHIFIVNRRFSSKTTPAIFDPDTNKFELEEIKDGVPTIVPADSILPHIKQADWEAACWDEDEEDLLQKLYAAHFRAAFNAAGVEPWEYELYRSFVSVEIAGLSSHAHSVDWAFLQDPSCESFEQTTAEEHNLLVKRLRAMSLEDRAAEFRAAALAPKPALRELKTTHDFIQAAWALPNAPIVLWLASPASAVAETFLGRPGLAARVAFVSAMAGCRTGGKSNLIGGCFNDVVANLAARHCYETNMFRSARIVFTPTETLKTGHFSIQAEDIAAMPANTNPKLQKVLVDSIRLWTDLKQKKAQPLFDAAILLQEEALKIGVVAAETAFFDSDDWDDPTLENPFAKLRMDIVARSGEGRLHLDSVFLPGKYTTEYEGLKPECSELLPNMIRATLE